MKKTQELLESVGLKWVPTFPNKIPTFYEAFQGEPKNIIVQLNMDLEVEGYKEEGISRLLTIVIKERGYLKVADPTKLLKRFPPGLTGKVLPLFIWEFFKIKHGPRSYLVRSSPRVTSTTIGLQKRIDSLEEDTQKEFENFVRWQYPEYQLKKVFNKSEADKKLIHIIQMLMMHVSDEMEVGELKGFLEVEMIDAFYQDLKRGE